MATNCDFIIIQLIPRWHFFVSYQPLINPLSWTVCSHFYIFFYWLVCLYIQFYMFFTLTFISYSFNVLLILCPVCLFSCSILILQLSHIGSKEPFWKFYWQYQESLDQSGKLTSLWYWALPINIHSLIFHLFKSSLISFS